MRVEIFVEDGVATEVRYDEDGVQKDTYLGEVSSSWLEGYKHCLESQGWEVEVYGA